MRATIVRLRGSNWSVRIQGLDFQAPAIAGLIRHFTSCPIDASQKGMASLQQNVLAELYLAIVVLEGICTLSLYAWEMAG